MIKQNIRGGIKIIYFIIYFKSRKKVRFHSKIGKNNITITLSKLNMNFILFCYPKKMKNFRIILTILKLKITSIHLKIIFKI